ncbi:NAD(P)H-hydrate dehydratase [Sphingomonas turrisvirgatae]|uniref:Bifunctional NAD(P)H-hydrate repair enzyme n=1 Tax=Sphingomonas turrisvirgatae TaxID=1888892 RepID=A0A1E3LZV3_9SPHN|nr:NAD(P)H-hydrate dehydratase [Sphingomonas turrisvirgatae]ODP39301.1 bifunctional ADP-dependent (S)-NAD(P)H-hydrate dehydratase/NAD(P)H-hydrate epimerase [Sphingomonas turrisvirgatae]
MNDRGDPILTAGQMRAAEAAAIAAGASVEELMERAGRGIADWVQRLAFGAPVLILCGPGNNGGDGYLAARLLAARGLGVRVAALAEPRTPAAIAARGRWTGPVEPFTADLPAEPILVDALFGTGLTRPLDHDLASSLRRLVEAAQLAIAVDVPSGADADHGGDRATLAVPRYGITLALGARKPAHVLYPMAAQCGTVRVIDLGLPETVHSVRTLGAPGIAQPQYCSHKYSRGIVAIIGGPMHGAAELAARAAYGAGAGYVVLLSGALPHPPHAIVRRRWSPDALADTRIGAVIVGPGLGRDDHARAKLATALGSSHPLVIDGDALHLIDRAELRNRAVATVLTPHAGEFGALFGHGSASKIVRAQEAAEQAPAVVVFKGADTVIADPSGHVQVASGAPFDLAVAGTGDVLAGAIGAMLAQNQASPFEAAAAGVWLHGEAARQIGRPFLADELAAALPIVLGASR